MMTTISPDTTKRRKAKVYVCLMPGCTVRINPGQRYCCTSHAAIHAAIKPEQPTLPELSPRKVDTRSKEERYAAIRAKYGVKFDEATPVRKEWTK